MGWLLYSNSSDDGPVSDDTSVIDASVRGELTGHSARFAIEGPVLLVDGDVPLAIRLDEGTLLVRRDLPDELVWATIPLVESLTSAGYALLDEETLLAGPVALQVVGLRISAWDLWGVELDQGFASLRAAAVGETWNPVLDNPNERTA